MGKNFRNIGRFENSNISVLNQKYQTLIEGRSIVPFELPFLNESGETRWLTIQGSLVEIENKKFIQVILQDITDRKIAEQKLKESELKYRHLFESAPFIIGLGDLNGNILDVNSTVNKFLTSRTKDDLIGKNLREVYSFYDEEKPIINIFTKKIEELKQGKPLVSFEFPFVRKTGRIQWASFQGSMIKIRDQKLVQFIIQDITDRKNAEQELKKSEEKFRSIFESIPDIYFMVSKSGEILDYRGENKDLFLPPENFLGKNLIVLLPGDLGSRAANAIESTIQTKKQNIIEYNLPIQGENRYYEARFLYFSEDRVAIFIREITERKKVEILIEEELEKLKELEQIRKDLISRVSHELKTPLIPVISGAELLTTVYKDQIGKNALEIIEMIDKGGSRLKDLIEQLINVSRIEYRKMEIKKSRNDLCLLVRENIKDMKYILAKKQLTLKTQISDSILLEIDKNRIGEVITNLLSNAIKNTPPGGAITIIVTKENHWAKLKVRDTGVGLTEKEKQVLFTRFGKIDRYQEGLEYIDIKGSGLGLYISKQIIDQHGGEIWAESKGRNKGSTFIVKLPIP
jgi:PAS domain S-box-containing protein